MSCERCKVLEEALRQISEMKLSKGGVVEFYSCGAIARAALSSPTAESKPQPASESTPEPKPSGVRWFGWECGCRWRICGEDGAYIPCRTTGPGNPFKKEQFNINAPEITDPATIARLEAEWQKGQGGK